MMPILDPDWTSDGMGDAGDITPGLEGAVTGDAMVGGSQAVATELEEVVDLAVAGEKPLNMARRLEALHLPFSSPCRLVRDFGLIVEVAALPERHHGSHVARSLWAESW
jgi:hypothetical protein